MAGRVFAMGGGGFSMEPENTLLDDFLLSLAPAGRSPRVCFVPTASGDADGYIARFMAAFPPSRAEASVLSLFKREVQDLREFVLGHDIMYVGGGNTANLLAVWRAQGLDAVLAEAYREGVVMAGVSAGMNCWFEASMTDSYDVNGCDPLMDGLGLLRGSGCPHYDGEAQRRPAYLSAVAEGMPDGFAAGDGSGLLFSDGELVDAVSSRRSAVAFHVDAANDGPVRETAVELRYLGQPSGG
jgi:peptidase E